MLQQFCVLIVVFTLSSNLTQLYRPMHTHMIPYHVYASSSYQGKLCEERTGPPSPLLYNFL
jgi:hypothetical protein